MRAFDIKVTFHLEPYSADRGVGFADDVTYILREYGERRRWDTMLLLEDADGRRHRCSSRSSRCCRRPRPTAKASRSRSTSTFRTTSGGSRWRASGAMWPETSTGSRSSPTRSTPTARAPRALTPAPSAIPTSARTSGPGSPARSIAHGIPFSFAVNAGFDAVAESAAAGSLLSAAGVRARAERAVGSARSSRELAQQLGTARIAASLERTLAHQTDPESANWRKGFLLVPINSFNEWHEGTAFEPMASYRDLSPSRAAAVSQRDQRLVSPACAAEPAGVGAVNGWRVRPALRHLQFVRAGARTGYP